MDNYVIMSPITLTLSEAEVAIIRSWYEYATNDSFRYGGLPQIFPTEGIAIAKINGHTSGPITLSRSDLACIVDWMEQAVSRKYGSEQVLFGFENLLYRKIRTALGSD